MTPEEFSAASDQVRQHGWFLTNKKLGEGGGGATYLCVRIELVSGMHSHAKELVTANWETAYPAAVYFVEHLVRAPGSFGVFKFSKHRDARFKREIKALTKCKHRHLVSILAFDQSDEPAWYIMEFFAGGTTQDSWAAFKGQPLDVLRGALGIAEALTVLHEARLIHRDIKPENIFVARGGHWHLGDLGIAFDGTESRLTEAQERRPPMNRFQRPDWAVARPELEATPAYDIYQLAHVVHSLIAGPDKTPPASQIDEADFALPALFPGTPHVKDVQQFLREHIVTREADVKSRTAKEFAGRVKALIALFDQRVVQQQVLSWFSSHSVTNVGGGEPWPLHDMRISLPANTIKLRGALRLHKSGERETGQVRLTVRNRRRVPDPSEPVSAIFDNTIMVNKSEEQSQGEWLDFEMNQPSSLPAGWHFFNVDQMMPNVHITAITLYADARV